jgi:hypothetical protein
MHITDGEIRAYLDQELPLKEITRIKTHLETCSVCQRKSISIKKESELVSSSIASLKLNASAKPHSSQEALKLLENRIQKKESIPMLKNIFSPQYRIAWIAFAVIAILAIAFAFPDVRVAANNFLSLFRVQQFTVVQFNPEDVQNDLGSSSHFEHMLSEDVQIEDNGEPFEVTDAGEASAKTGIPVRLPSDIEGEQKLMVIPGGRITFDIDLSRVEMLLTEIDQGDIELPPELDGSKVSMEIPTVAVASYGECDMPINTPGSDPDEPSTHNAECTTLHQMVSPTISAPPDLDVTQIGEAFLQLLGMSPQEAALFSESVDWTTTLIVPIPRYSTSYQEVFVDGVNATLILQQDYVPRYMLLWVKNNIIYALSGPGDSSTALAIANTLK